MPPPPPPSSSSPSPFFSASSFSDASPSTSSADSGLTAFISRYRRHRALTRPLISFLTAPSATLPLPPALTALIDSHVRSAAYLPSQHTPSLPSSPSHILCVHHALRYATVHRVLSEVRRRLPWLRPTAVYDAAFHTGHTAWAVKEVWGGWTEYRGVEGRADVAKLGREVVAPLGSPITVVPALPSLSHPLTPSELVVCAYGLLEMGKDRRRITLQRLWGAVKGGGVLVLVEEGTQEGFDVIRSARQQLLQSHVGGRPTKQPKEGVASKETDALTAAADGIATHPLLPVLPAPTAPLVSPGPSSPTVLAPCGHDAVCPQGKDGVCAFAQRLLQSTLPKTSPYRRVKTKDRLGGVLLERFSYVVLHKGPITPQGSYDENERVDPREAEGQADVEDSAETVQVEEQTGEAEGESETNLTARAEGEVSEEAVAEVEPTSALPGDGQPAADLPAGSDPPLPAPPLPLPPAFYVHRYHRLLSPVLQRGEHVVMDVCSTDGHLERRTVGKNSSGGVEGPYRQARHAKWGDLWQHPRRGRGMGRSAEIRITRTVKEVKTAQDEDGQGKLTAGEAVEGERQGKKGKKRLGGGGKKEAVADEAEEDEWRGLKTGDSWGRHTSFILEERAQASLAKRTEGRKS